MAISEDFIERLKQYNDMQSTMSSYVTLKRKGSGYVCLCPFHSEKTPSCTLFPETQSFYCFGCGAGGDVITFIMKIENLEYMEALRFLAQKAGLPMPEDVQNDDTAKLKMRILEINRKSARFFHSQLYSPAGKAALEYLHNRGFSADIIKKFGIGFAANTWDSLRNYLKRQGYKEDELVTAYLIARGRTGNLYDVFRNRIIIPIIDLRGNVIGFGGRLLADDGPKYLNSSDTPVFKKSRNLFSLNFAKSAKGRTLILAEGYMDVIAIYSAGFPNVVATLGTALTKEQARLMGQYADEVIIAYDSDSAGQAATHKAINLLNEVGVNTRIIKMGDAKDPDEFIRKNGVTRFKLLLDNADNAFEFELNKQKVGIDIGTDSGKVEYLKRCVPILANMPSSIERDVYSSRIATELGVSKEAILIQVNSLIKRQRRSRHKREFKELLPKSGVNRDKINPQAAHYPLESKAEEGIIAYAFKNPNSIDYILSKIRFEDFVTDFNRKVFEAVAIKLQNNISLNLSALGGEFTSDEMGKISGMLANYNDVNNSPELLSDYIDTLLSHKNSISRERAAKMSDNDLIELQNKLKSQQNHG
ncbi:MAG: DNA primase [Clostridiales bacterium]|nr:DNA primase [Clostridiales bacterium]